MGWDVSIFGTLKERVWDLCWAVPRVVRFGAGYAAGRYEVIA